MATVDTLLVRIEADMADLRRDLDKIGAQSEKTASKMEQSFQRAGRALAAIGGIAAVGGLVRGFIQTGAEVENLGVRFNTLFGSVEEGSRAFQVMAAYAAEVPFSLEDIQRGAGPLATVGKNAEDLGALMKLTGNIAAASGLSFEEASQNIQRALSGGIASADQFRERGVSAMAGFQAGVSYSVEETVTILNDAFGVGGKYDGITDNLAKTTTGALSMLRDSYFTFQRTVAESGLNEAFIKLVNSVKALIDELRPLAVVIGRALGYAFGLLAGAVQLATRYMDGLFVAFTAFLALNAAAKVLTLYNNMVALAKIALINRNVFKSLNAIIRRNPLILLAIGAAATVEALGGINAVLEGLETQFPRVFGGLTESAEEFFGGAGEGLEEIKELLRTPLSIEIGGEGGGKAASKLMTQLKGIISQNTPEVEKLQEQWDLLNNNIGLFSGEKAIEAQVALDQLAQKIREQNPLYSSALSAVQGFASSISGALADAVMSGRLSMSSLADAFKSMVRQIVAKAIELLIVNRILAAMFPGAYKSAGGGAYIPVRASGGSMNAGQPYLVGERGPELIVPQSASTAMNAGQTRSAAQGGGGTIVNQTINVSAGVAQTVKAEMLSMLPQIKADTMRSVADANMRGGSYRRSLA